MYNETGFELPIREVIGGKGSYVHNGGTGGWWSVLQYLALEAIEAASQQASDETDPRWPRFSQP